MRKFAVQPRDHPPFSVDGDEWFVDGEGVCVKRDGREVLRLAPSEWVWITEVRDE